MEEIERQRARVLERIHIVEGLVAMGERDDLHVRLRSCETNNDAIELLVGPDFGLSKIQALHLLDTPNRRSVGQARAELSKELEELRAEADRLA